MYNKEEAKQLRLDFWNGFGVYSKKLAYLKPNRGRWIMHYTGIKNLDLKFDIQRFELRVVLEVNHSDEDLRLAIYSQLDSYKTIIDNIVGPSLIWDYTYTTPSGNEVCRIYTECLDFDFHKRQHWPEMYKYMADNMMLLEKAFLEIKEGIEV